MEVVGLVLVVEIELVDDGLLEHAEVLFFETGEWVYVALSDAGPFGDFLFGADGFHSDFVELDGDGADLIGELDAELEVVKSDSIAVEFNDWGLDDIVLVGDGNLVAGEVFLRE